MVPGLPSKTLFDPVLERRGRHRRPIQRACQDCRQDEPDAGCKIMTMNAISTRPGGDQRDVVAGAAAKKRQLPIGPKTHTDLVGFAREAGILSQAGRADPRDLVHDRLAWELMASSHKGPCADPPKGRQCYPTGFDAAYLRQPLSRSRCSVDQRDQTGKTQVPPPQYSPVFEAALGVRCVWA